MDPREALPIIFCSTPKAKVLAYLLVLILLTIFSPGPEGLLFLLLPLALDARGAFLVKDNHKAFQEDVIDELTKECLAACGIKSTAPHYVHHDIGGKIEHWLIKDLKSEVSMSMMAPKQDCVVIAKRVGRIFPLKTYLTVRYDTKDAGTRDVYYSDIAAVELSGSTLTMTTTAGEPVVYEGQGAKAEEAARRIRDRLREFKASSPTGNHP